MFPCYRVAALILGDCDGSDFAEFADAAPGNPDGRIDGVSGIVVRTCDQQQMFVFIHEQADRHDFFEYVRDVGELLPFADCLGVKPTNFNHTD